MKHALLLIGRPGVGQTTIIRTVAARLEASVNISSLYRVGKDRVHLRDLEQVEVKALLRANRQALPERIYCWLLQKQGETVP